MAFGDHSPSAALTGTRPPTFSMTAATTSASAGASGPLAGSFTSIRSAPPASAAFTSSADRTLTRSLGVALIREESFLENQIPNHKYQITNNLESRIETITKQARHRAARLFFGLCSAFRFVGHCLGLGAWHLGFQLKASSTPETVKNIVCPGYG